MTSQPHHPEPAPAADTRLAGLLNEHPELRGYLYDDHYPTEITRCLTAIKAATGLHIVCLWTACALPGPALTNARTPAAVPDWKAWAFDGGSTWYVAGPGVRLHHLTGDLRTYLCGDPTSPATPTSPGSAASWIGELSGVNVTALAAYNPTTHNWGNRKFAFR